MGDFWSSVKIKEAFKRMEKYNGLTTCTRGQNGKVDIRQAPVLATSMASKFAQAVSASTGFAEILDYSSRRGYFKKWDTMNGMCSKKSNYFSRCK